MPFGDPSPCGGSPFWGTPAGVGAARFWREENSHLLIGITIAFTAAVAIGLPLGDVVGDLVMFVESLSASRSGEPLVAGKRAGDGLGPRNP